MAPKDRLGLRQMSALPDLTRPEMLGEIAAGLPLVLNSANELAAAADALPPQHGRSKAILLLHAEEEAAKFLMLLDLVRCPRRQDENRRRLARNIYDHLARLIYAESCGLRPATFGELGRYVEQARKEFYLDGPNSVDFIYLNDLIHRREALLYADRVRWEHGYEWQKAGSPWGSEPLVFRKALETANALAEVGALRPDALPIIDAEWDRLALRDETHWQEIAALNRRTLERFETLGWLHDATEDSVHRALEWPMPLYALDVGPKKVEIEALRGVRERYAPDW
jgi:hypothetical protein